MVYWIRPRPSGAQLRPQRAKLGGEDEGVSGRNGPVSTGLTRETLHEVLVPRTGFLREYLDRRIPPSLRSMLAVDDLLQEVWIAAYRNVASFRPHGADALERWLVTIAHSRLVDAVRWARRVKRGGDIRYLRLAGNVRTTFTDALSRVPAACRTPSADAQRIETAHAMLIALERLEERQRRAVELYFLRGRSRQQVAEELQTSEKAVSDLVHRSLMLLRGVLGPAVKYFSDARTADPVDREPAHASD